MSFRFTYHLTRVVCQSEQLNEWGRDEMKLFGLAVSRLGHLFVTGYRNLGSYSESDVGNPPHVPQLLLEAELDDAGLDVLFYYWLVEQDGGGVGDQAAAIEQRFRENYQAEVAELQSVQFPRDCIPFAAFLKAALPMDAVIRKAATAGKNDQVFVPYDRFIRFQPGASLLDSGGEHSATHSHYGGRYDLYFRFNYRRILDLDPEPDRPTAPIQPAPG